MGFLKTREIAFFGGAIFWLFQAPTWLLRGVTGGLGHPGIPGWWVSQPGFGHGDPGPNPRSPAGPDPVHTLSPGVPKITRYHRKRHNCFGKGILGYGQNIPAGLMAAGNGPFWGLNLGAKMGHGTHC